MQRYDLLKLELREFRKAFENEKKERRRELKLQAKEYKRRLKVLNGEGNRIEKIVAETIPREVFDRAQNTLNDKIQILTSYKNAQEGKGSGANALWGYIAGIIILACIVITLVVNLRK